MLNPLVSGAVYALEAVIFYVFFARVSTPKLSRWKILLIGLGLFEIGSVFNILFQNTVLVNTIVTLFVITLFFRLCFETSIKVALLYSLLLDGLNFAIESIIVFFFLPCCEYQPLNIKAIS